MAGSRAFGGAAHLAGLGALRSGAGLVTLAAPVCLETALRSGLPEALIMAVAETDAGTIAPLDRRGAWTRCWTSQHALAVGPGLGADPDTDAWVVELLGGLELPVVVDADALNAFARTGPEPAFGTDQVVLTPHAGELARLVGTDQRRRSSADRLRPGRRTGRPLERAC